MLGSTVRRRIARFGAAAGIAAIGFLGLSQAAQAQTVAPYPTPSTAPATTQPPAVSATTIGTDVHASDANNVSSAPVVDASELPRTGTDSGKIALLGLAALGAGGVCVSAARRRSTQS